LGIPQTEEARSAYRELIVTTPGLGECSRGVILYDETIRQQKKDGTPFVKAIAEAGIIPGGEPRFGDTASSVSSSQLQSGCAPWRIQCPDGEDISITPRISRLSRSAA
jgi:hypothetical protein